MYIPNDVPRIRASSCRGVCTLKVHKAIQEGVRIEEESREKGVAT